MPRKESYIDKLKRAFSRISGEEAKALFEHLSTAWRAEELIPQPEGYILLPMERIVEPEDPIRKDLGDLESLGRSINREEVLQPICVRPLDDEWREFEPVIGLRRYQACKEVGKESIPAYVREVDREEAPRIALEENRFRKDLEPPELLGAMMELRDQGWTQARIAETADMKQPQVSAYLRIPELPEAMKNAFFRKEISIGHVQVLLGLGGKARKELFERILKEGLSGKGSRSVAKLIKGEIEVPAIFDGKEFEALLGRNIDFRSSSWGITFTAKADDKGGLVEILARTLSKEGLIELQSKKEA